MTVNRYNSYVPMNSWRFLVLFFAFLTPFAAYGSKPADPKSLSEEKEATVKRRQAVEDLVQKNDPQAGPALVKALKDKDPYLRSRAVRGIGQIRYVAGASNVAELLEKDPNPQVRQSAALVMSVLHADMSRPVLEKALKDADVAVRAAAVNGLGNLNDPQVVPALAETAKDSSVIVRRVVTGNLIRFNTPEAKAVLETLEKDPDPVVQKLALSAKAKSKPEKGKKI